MSAANDGGPAFPVHANHALIDGRVVAVHEQGMSLRDWFAGQALTWFLACPDIHGNADTLAKHSYAYADAMLRAREGSQIANPTDELPDEHWHKIQTRPSLSWHPTREWEAACEMRGKMMYGRGKTIAAAQAALRAEWEGGAQ